MMVEPSVSELLKKVDSRFKLVAVTSKRARQISEERYEKIQGGDKPEEIEESAVTIAAKEIAEGKVREATEEDEKEAEEVEEVEEAEESESGKEEEEC